MRSRAVFERNVLSECQDGEWDWGKSHTSHVLRECVIRDDPLFPGFAPSKMQFHRKRRQSCSLLKSALQEMSQGLHQSLSFLRFVVKLGMVVER